MWQIKTKSRLSEATGSFETGESWPVLPGFPQRVGK